MTSCFDFFPHFFYFCVFHDGHGFLGFVFFFFQLKSLMCTYVYVCVLAEGAGKGPLEEGVDLFGKD